MITHYAGGKREQLQSSRQSKEASELRGEACAGAGAPCARTQTCQHPYCPLRGLTRTHCLPSQPSGHRHHLQGNQGARVLPLQHCAPGRVTSVPHDKLLSLQA